MNFMLKENSLCILAIAAVFAAQAIAVNTDTWKSNLTITALQVFPADIQSPVIIPKAIEKFKTIIKELEQESTVPGSTAHDLKKKITAAAKELVSKLTDLSAAPKSSKTGDLEKYLLKRNLIKKELDGLNKVLESYNQKLRILVSPIGGTEKARAYFTFSKEYISRLALFTLTLKQIIADTLKKISYQDQKIEKKLTQLK